MTIRRTAVVAAMVAALALAGCAPQGETAPAAEDGGTETLIWGQTAPITNLDPHKTSFSDCHALCPVYDRLIHVNPDGSLIPGLAESWEYSADSLTLTFTMRDDATFSDGSAVTADAVKVSLDRARTLEESVIKNDFASVEDIDVDGSTVNVNLKTADASLPAILSGLSGAVINPKAIEDGTDLSATMAGAGAFTFVEFVEGTGLTLERRDDYWGEEPALAGLEFKIVADAAALANSLLAGQIDAASILPQNVTPFVGNDDFVIEEESVLVQYAILSNRILAGFEDEEVRQAIVHALDRDAICETVFSGYCTVTDQAFPPGHYAYDDTLADPLYDYDPAKAKKLLAAAGASDLSFTAVVPPVGRQFAEALQAQLAEVGVTMAIEPVEITSMMQTFLVDKTSQATTIPFTGRTDPSQMLGARYSEAGFYNPGGYTTDKMQKLYLESMSETDPDARTEVLKAASREAAETALTMSLGFAKRAYVMKEGITFPVYVSGIQELTGATKAP